MTGVRCRLVAVVECRGEYGVFWPGPCTPPGRSLDDHVARRDVGPIDPGAVPDLDADDATGWDGACDRCGTPVDWTVPVRRFASNRDVYDTDDGRLSPGDMFWTDHRGRFGCTWSNCDGRHLHVMLPNRHTWDIDSRAANCDRPDDTEHRCWVRDGEPPDVTAGKAGNTCSAGGGSIQSADYHGFLRDGFLTVC